MSQPAGPYTLRAIADRLEIGDLTARLGACLDEHRFGDLQALFTDDATVSTPGGTARGRTAAVAQATRNHAGHERLQHVISNVLVELDGDRATVRANLVAIFAGEGRPPQLGLGAVYRFEVRRVPDGWRFARLEVEPAWRLAPAPEARAGGDAGPRVVQS